MTENEKILFQKYVNFQTSIIRYGLTDRKKKNIEKVLLALGFTGEEIEDKRLYII